MLFPLTLATVVLATCTVLLASVVEACTASFCLSPVVYLVSQTVVLRGSTVSGEAGVYTLVSVAIRTLSGTWAATSTILSLLLEVTGTAF